MLSPQASTPTARIFLEREIKRSSRPEEDQLVSTNQFLLFPTKKPFVYKCWSISLETSSGIWVVLLEKLPFATSLHLPQFPAKSGSESDFFHLHTLDLHPENPNPQRSYSILWDSSSIHFICCNCMFPDASQLLSTLLSHKSRNSATTFSLLTPTIPEFHGFSENFSILQYLSPATETHLMGRQSLSCNGGPTSALALLLIAPPEKIIRELCHFRLVFLTDSKYGKR